MNELTVRSGFNTKWVCHKFVRVNQFSEFWDLWIVEKGFGNCCLSGALSLSSVVVVQSLSRVWIFVTWWTVAFQASLSFTISLHLLKLMSIESVMPSNHFILYHPFLLLPLIFPSTRVLSNELALCIRWPKYWSFSFSTSPSMTIQGWFLLGLTGLISLQSKGLSTVFSSTTFQKHQFFGAPLSLWSNSSHPYMTVGKVIALTRLICRQNN